MILDAGNVLCDTCSFAVTLYTSFHREKQQLLYTDEMELAVQVREPYVDPRIRRTRLMLERSLEELLSREDLDSISISDIADAATVNRATFYAHFVDKFDLLSSLVTTRFEELLSARGVVFDGGCASALYALVLAVCDFLNQNSFCSQRRNVAQHLELAMVGVVRGVLAEGVRKHHHGSETDPDMVAAAMAGAIYASAKQWFQTDTRVNTEQAARTITALITPLLA